MTARPLAACGTRGCAVTAILPPGVLGRADLQTSLPRTGAGITTFPRAPGMAATWNMSAVAAMAGVFATEARSIFNEGTIAGSTFSCPGSIVLW